MDAGRGLREINSAIDAGTDPRQFGQQVVEHLRCILLTQTAGTELVEASNEDRAMYAEQAGQIQRAVLVRAIRAFNEAVNNYKGGWQPQLSLELALIESVRGPAEAVRMRLCRWSQQAAPLPQTASEAPTGSARPSAEDATPASPAAVDQRTVGCGAASDGQDPPHQPGSYALFPCAARRWQHGLHLYR